MASLSSRSLSPAVVVALCASLLGCGGSSSETPAAHPGTPSLANFSYAPASAALNSGGGAATMSFGADEADTGADVTRVVIIVKSAAGATLATFDIPMTNPPGVTAWRLQGTINFPTATVTSYGFTVQVFDVNGTGSNVASGTFRVL